MSKYGVFSGSYLDTFHAMRCLALITVEKKEAVGNLVNAYTLVVFCHSNKSNLVKKDLVIFKR